ncbi:hypothetical protein [Streptomyces sp. WAC08241]|uniref:DUF7848 domain-containing protein n=1 Tax=Streptomyces sp. WAC08241 TaxID=2487421 RepID=UPI000F7A0570|nr:hypothetical protein [Streptomyces sp. WAC08241]RSS44243.1 hypothetical protein EF906_07660 [Streptomyces sp. WAC08241]
MTGAQPLPGTAPLVLSADHELRPRPEPSPGCTPCAYRFRCLALDDDDTECGAESEPGTDPVRAQTWPFEHLRAHPEHTGFAEIVERPWVMWRGTRA